MSEKHKRQGQHKKKSVPSTWRKPVGRHSRVRLEKKSAPAKPKAGRRTNKAVRGKHPSGFNDVVVNNTEELEDLDPEEDAARIASKVGGRKREQIIEKADELDIKILNNGDSQ